MNKKVKINENYLLYVICKCCEFENSTRLILELNRQIDTRTSVFLRVGRIRELAEAKRRIASSQKFGTTLLARLPLYRAFVRASSWRVHFDAHARRRMHTLSSFVIGTMDSRGLPYSPYIHHV